jgi:hypothetical protein
MTEETQQPRLLTQQENPESLPPAQAPGTRVGKDPQLPAAKENTFAAPEARPVPSAAARVRPTAAFADFPPEWTSSLGEEWKALTWDKIVPILQKVTKAR